MFLKIIFFLIIFTLLEMYILILAGSKIGANITFAILILNGLSGVIMAKINGSFVLKEMMKSIKRNQVPAFEVIEGLLILIGAIALIIPGFISDILGYILITNFSRRFILRKYLNHIQSSDLFTQIKLKLYEELVRKGYLGT